MPRNEASTERGAARREQLLLAAAELFRKHGFHGTGIDEIGAAVGITGPGVYRHFAGKHDILAAVLDLAQERLQDALEGVLENAATPLEALEGFVDRTAAACIADRDLSAIYFREVRHLNPEDKERMSAKQKAMTERWIDVLRGVRPDMSDAQLRTAVVAMSRLLNSVAHYPSQLEPVALRRFLSELALGALLAPHA